MIAPKLQLLKVKKKFPGSETAAVDGVNLSIYPGETVALLGPSGCGKSTLLNIIVGLESPTSGDVRIDGRPVLDIPAGQRNVGLVFQDYAVFTHMTVAQNLAFGLEVRGMPRADVDRAVREVAELLGMTDHLKVKARELGGSQLQRVAIARTLVTKPAILLLDEPLSNLEAGARLTMRRELRRLQQEIGLTIVYVTHDQVEALSLASRIAVMSGGQIRQVESSAQIYDEPDHVFVASFLGSPAMNLLRGQLGSVKGGTGYKNGVLQLALPDVQGSGNQGVPEQIYLGVRPEKLFFVAPGSGKWTGRVNLVELRGAEAVATVELETGADCLELKVLVSARRRPADGELVGVDVHPQDCLVYSHETGRRLHSPTGLHI